MSNKNELCKLDEKSLKEVLSNLRFSEVMSLAHSEDEAMASQIKLLLAGSLFSGTGPTNDFEHKKAQIAAHDALNEYNLKSGIAPVILDKLNESAVKSRIRNGARPEVITIVSLLYELPLQQEHTFLENIKSYSPELVKEIKKHQFTFDDIFRLDDRGLQALIREIKDKKVVYSALQAASPCVKAAFEKNMTKLSWSIAKEEISLMRTNLGQSYLDQNFIADTAKRLRNEGKLMVRRGKLDYISQSEDIHSNVAIAINPLLNLIDDEAEQKFIHDLVIYGNYDLRNAIEANRISFDDLLKISDSDFKILLRKVPNDKLTIASVKANPLFIEKLKVSVSERAFQLLSADLESCITFGIRDSDIRYSREEITSIAGAMAKDGIITINLKQKKE